MVHIGVQALFSISLLSFSVRCIAFNPQLYSQSPLHQQTREALTDKLVRFAVFGDSWASGINWGPPSEETEYNFPDSEEVCRCRRINEAWPVQLLRDQDTAWINGRPLELDFQACHGAFFPDIIDQVRRMDQLIAPDFALLMVGGNPGGFPEIIDDCIYQFNNDRDYGPDYPDPEGECFKALIRAHGNIRSPWFTQGILNSIDGILKEPRMWQNPRFRLFVVGYAGLFNHDDEKCNEWSFGIWPGKKPRVTKELRKAINDIVGDGMRLYEHLINQVLFSSRVKYIDVNYAFDHHRFCEPTVEQTFESQVENAWLYSIGWPNCIPLSSNRTVLLQAFKPQIWPDFCRDCGDLGQLGELQRLFHPNFNGHEAIKNALKDILRQEPLFT